jgi:RpiB/LacA/LacB family sugar-phosphate isomerase
MRIVVGADHRGYCLKDAIAAHLREAGHQVQDVGTNGPDSVDYPDLALAVGRVIQSREADRGILVCGSGVGAAIAANKLDGIRASIAHDSYSARQGVEHDDMNILCLGSRVVAEALAFELVNAFVNARFVPEDRYRRRLEKIRKLEEGAQSL